MAGRFIAQTVVWAAAGCLLAGCGGSPRKTADAEAKRTQAATGTPRPQKSSPGDRKTGTDPSRVTLGASKTPAKTAASPGGPGDHRTDDPPTPPTRLEGPLLSSLLDAPVDSVSKWIPNLPRMEIDDAQMAKAGIRKLAGKRLTLYTDLPDGPEIQRLPEVFDQAFPQWCAYFQIDPAEHADWNMTGFLIQDKARFQQAGLLPHGLPPFQHGFSRNHELWLYEQPSEYYRRHLLLHEGTHGLMNTLLRGCGPPWYMEGIAELLSTHRWQDGRLTLNYMPENKEEVPYLGRIEIIRDAIAAQRPMRLQQVLEYPPHAHLETEPYAWCWALAVLLDGHPQFQQRFRQLHKNVLEPDFTQRFYELLGDDLDRLREEWQVFVTSLEYGYDAAAMPIDFTPGRPMAASGTSVTVAANGGWQNSGLQLEGGASYRVQASGRYQVADQPQIWWCEPNGVSIRYYHGRPLGILLAAIRPDRPVPDDQSSGLLWPKEVGLGTTLTPKETGTLYFRINDSAAELDDNAGELTVAVGRG
ncbi:MAG TPA: hypothetical protein VMY42_23405 [Thermoguttaceae bacterium]|nr:hypothetical protein [Thermoguttaceae bacterium]